MKCISAVIMLLFILAFLQLASHLCLGLVYLSPIFAQAVTDMDPPPPISLCIN